MSVEGVPLSISACKKCYDVFSAFAVHGVTFEEVCGRCATDEAFNEDYNKAIGYSEVLVQSRPFADDSVASSRMTGYRVSANFEAKKRR